MEEQRLLKKKRALLTKGPKIQLATFCNDLAEIYSREGKFELAIKEYKEEAQLYKELDKQILYAKANRMIGEIYTNIAEFDNALKHEHIHLDIAVKEKNDLERQRALASIGRTHLTIAISDFENNQSESLSLALKSFSQSLMIAESLKDISKREQMDMKARLLLNIGVVYEHQGDFTKGTDYMNKSIQICKTYDIYEQLHLGYHSLGLLNTKQKDYKSAIQQYNFAVDVANRLSDKIPPLCATLTSKADVFVKLGDFNSAKYTLLKAYKLKSPNQDERKLIEHNLKVVAAMCMTEEQLLLTDLDNKKKKSLYEKMGDGACDLKNFPKAIDYYKKMLECAIAAGDTGKDLIPVYVSLAQTYKDNKEYDQAVHYFQKDLEITRHNSEESCETLLNIAEVLELAKRPYEQIAKVIEKARQQARNSGKMKLEGKVIKQFINLKKKFNKNSEAAELENQLIMMDYVESDDDDDDDDDSEEDVNGTPDIGDDINISDISDPSDNEQSNEEESPNRSRTTRRRGKTFKIKKDIKGETQLHKACIKGNIYLVTRLIDQGHPINIRDNSGWLPIHEAANYGFTEIVRILIEKGANINDRGGTHCGGITPLHDACSNGHLDLIEFMLDHGASPLSQTNSGETPLDMLRIWRQDTDLDPIQQTHYETISSRLITALEKAGRSVNTTKRKETSHEELEVFYKSPNKKTPNTTPMKLAGKSVSSPYKKTPTPVKIGSLRHKVDTNDDDDDDMRDAPSCSGYNNRDVPSTFESKRKQITKNLNFRDNRDNSSCSENSDIETGAGAEYKQIMEVLRKRCPEQQQENLKAKHRKSGFQDREDVGDEWLEDDLGVNQAGKKRKRNSGNAQQFIESTGMRRSNSFNATKNSLGTPTTKTFHNIELNDTDQENSINEINVETNPVVSINCNGYESSDSCSSVFSNKRRKSQSSLLDAGFCRKRSLSPLNNVNNVNIVNNANATTCVSKLSQKSYKRQQKLNSFVNLEADSTSNQIEASQLERSQYVNSTLNTTIRSVLAVNVRIDNKLWRVPIPANDIDQLNIGWLADEAAKRYYKKEGFQPTLQLETKEGANLANDDPLSIIFISPCQSVEINSVIVSMNLPPLPERYVEACSNCKIEVDKKIRVTLDECQGTLKLKLSNFMLKKIQLTPLFRALVHQDNLQYLDLSGNPLLNEGIKQLCTTLPSLTQLQSLNLSLTNISAEGLRHFSNIFLNSDKSILQNLRELNFSLNLLGDDCLSFLAIILQHINLRILNLSACDLTENIFDHLSNKGVALNFEYLEEFDLSYNCLNKDCIIMFMSFLNFNLVSCLNFSNNSAVTESGIAKEIAENLLHSDVINMKNICLERCKIHDSEIWDLLRPLVKAKDLETINLSYNDDLTSVTLRRILQHRPSFSTIILEGCKNIVEYLDQSLSITPNFNDSNIIMTLKSLKISFNYVEYSKEAEILTAMWQRQWGHKIKIEKMFNNLMHFTIID